MIDTIEWTKHAEKRRKEHRLGQFGVEEALRLGHGRRQENRGDGDWFIERSLEDRPGDVLAVVYDHSEDGDPGMARIVTVWT